MQPTRIISFLIFLEIVKNILFIITKFFASWNCWIKIIKLIYLSKFVNSLTPWVFGILQASKRDISNCMCWQIEIPITDSLKIHPLSVTHVTTKSHADVHCLCCSWSYIDVLVAIEGCVYANVLLQLESVLMYVGAPWFTVTILRSISHAAPGGVLMWMSCTAIQGRGCCPSFGLPLREGPVQVSGHTVTGGHVCGL